MPGSDMSAAVDAPEVQYCSDKGCFAIKLPSRIAQGCGLVQELNGAEGLTRMPFEVPSFLRWMDFVLKEGQDGGKTCWEPAELGWIIQVCSARVHCLMRSAQAHPPALDAAEPSIFSVTIFQPHLALRGLASEAVLLRQRLNRHVVSFRLRASCKTTGLSS